MRRQRIVAALGCAGWSVLSLLVGALIFVALAALLMRLGFPSWTRWLVQFVGVTIAVYGVMVALGRYAQQLEQTAEGEQATQSLVCLDTSEVYQNLSRPQRSAFWYTITATGLLAIASMLASALLMYRLTPVIQSMLYHHPKDLFFIPVDPWAPALAAMFLGILIAGLFSDAFARWLAGEHWEAIKPLVYHPFGEAFARRLNRYSLLGVGLMGLLLALAIDCYTRVTPDGFYFNRFWSLREKFYPLSAVESAAYVTRYKHRLTGNIQSYEDPYYEIRFRDGFTFSSAHTAYRNRGDIVRLIRWLQREHAVPMREVTVGVDWH